MEILVVAAHAPQRWSLAESLRVQPDDALPPPEGFARLVHPVGCSADAVVLVLGDESEVEVLERLTARTRPTPPLVVLAMSQGHADMARRAGVAGVVEGFRLEVADHAIALRSKLGAHGRGARAARASA